MKLAGLKKVRLMVSITFIVLTSILFLDIKNYLPAELFQPVLFLQFLPSLLKFMTIPALAAIGFMLIIILTLLFGRVYCSTICPLGTLQDIIARVVKKVRGKNKYKYSKPMNRLRYSIMGLALLLLFSGNIILLNLLDPYSNFGRMSFNFFRPLLVYSNNGVASILETFNNYSLYPVEFKGLNYFSLLYTLIFSVILLSLVFSSGRLFCNTLCPVGAMLSIISKYSFFRIQIDESSCKGCGICERVCKAGCIENKRKSLDFDRCVSCFNCLEVCPSEGLKYKSVFNKTKDAAEEPDIEKRDFLKNTAFFWLGAGTISLAQFKITPKKQTTIAEKKHFPVSPPGSISIKEYNDKCTACTLCVSNCPTQVLQPAYLEYGFLSIMQPRMDYSKSFCNYDCNMCGKVCPTGAIQPLPLEKKKLSQVGVAKFIKDNCIVYTENTDCGACSEHCPTKAVNMVPYKNLYAPQVTENLCIGCGACEHACPTKPYKAIYVDGKYIHGKAEKAKEVKEEKKAVQEDFPF